jgi:hypothetical protein
MSTRIAVGPGSGIVLRRGGRVRNPAIKRRRRRDRPLCRGRRINNPTPSTVII